MKKLFNRIHIIVFIFGLFIFPNTIKAEEPSPDSTVHNSNSNYDYIITKYNVDVVVNENNVFDITETITANFYVPKEEIIRTIPFQNDVKKKIEITNINVDHDYTTSKENDNYKIKIANNNAIGEQTFVINYNYDVGKDTHKEKDELYYNIIDNSWDTIIEKVTFNITMPKEFTEDNLNFSLGSKNLADSNKVDYKVDNNKISGSYNEVLTSKEELSISCELPEGYFISSKTKINIWLLLIILSVLFGGIIIFLKHKSIPKNLENKNIK